MLKIYTKKGDDGTTGLWYGGRVEKSGLRTDAYGTLDEACSALGVARAMCDDSQTELAADILARWVMAPQELPVGVLTALLGGGYLLWLMHRRGVLGGGS